MREGSDIITYSQVLTKIQLDEASFIILLQYICYMTSLDKLTEIPRITESKVDSFREAGFEELEDLVDLTEEDLS